MSVYYGESKETLKRREGRLRKIQKRLAEALTEMPSEEADKFEVIYKPINEYWSGVLGEKFKIPIDDSPAYGFFVKSKSGMEKPYNIMNLFRKDVDRRVSNKNFDREYQIPAFKGDIREHIASLRKSKSKKKENGLESKFVILLIGALCIGGYFLFSNPKITGNVIANLNIGSSFLISFILVCIIGLVGYFYIKK